MFEDLVNIYDDFTKNERTQSLSRFAVENDLGFIKREPFGEQVTLLRNFRIFKGKGVKRFIGVIKIPTTESFDAEIRFYDYLVTKDLETRSTSVIEVCIPACDYGSFRIKPKNGISRLFSPTFSKSNRAKFNKRFTIDSSFDISPRTIDLMLTHPKLTVEGFQDTMLFYHRNESIELGDIFEYIEFAEDFISNTDSADSEDFV